MDRINEKIVKSTNTPNSKEVLWLDISAEQPVLKHFISGSWKVIAGGGGGGGTGAVDSVNGKTGVIVLDAKDVGAYEKPSSGIPASDLTSGVQGTLSQVVTNTSNIALNTAAIGSNTANIANLQAAYAGLTQSDIVPLESLPASGEANTIYRVAGTDSYTDYMWDGTDFIPMATYSNTSGDGIYDVSEEHSGATYENLVAALGTNGANIPVSIRKGGMSIKFIQNTPATYGVVRTDGLTSMPGNTTALANDSNVDTGMHTASELEGFTSLPSLNNNKYYRYGRTEEGATTYTKWDVVKASNDKTKYVQYRYTPSSYSDTTAGNTAFLNPDNWQGVDENVSSGSDNLVTSNAVAAAVKASTQNYTEKTLNEDVFVGLTGGNYTFYNLTNTLIPFVQEVRIFKYVHIPYTYMGDSKTINTCVIDIFDVNGTQYTKVKVIHLIDTKTLFGKKVFELEEEVSLKPNQAWGIRSTDLSLNGSKIPYISTDANEGDYIVSGLISVGGVCTATRSSYKTCVAIPNYYQVQKLQTLKDNFEAYQDTITEGTFVNEGTIRDIIATDVQCYLKTRISGGLGQWATNNSETSAVINCIGNMGGVLRAKNNISARFTIEFCRYLPQSLIEKKDGTELKNNYFIKDKVINGNSEEVLDIPVNTGCIIIRYQTAIATEEELISAFTITAPVANRNRDQVRSYLTREKTIWEKHPEADGLLYTHGGSIFQVNGQGYPQFVLLSDNHGSEKHLRDAVSIANGCVSVRGILMLGDNFQGDLDEDYDVILNRYRGLCKKPIFTILGNHDDGNSNLIKKGGSDKIRYIKQIKPMVDCGLLTEGEYVENSCYWYKDLSYKISSTGYYYLRIIGLNDGENLDDNVLYFDTTNWTPVEYDSEAPELEAKSYAVGDKVNVRVGGYIYDLYSFECTSACTVNSQWANSPKMKMIMGRVQYKKAQLDWLCETLNNTPSNYKIIILKHQTFSPTAVAQTDKKFCQSNMPQYASGNNLYSYVSTDIIYDILRAYTDKTEIDKNVVYGSDASVYNQQGEVGNKYAYNISYDFSSSNGAKVIAILGGHTHQDILYKKDEFWNVITTSNGSLKNNSITGQGDMIDGIYENGSYTVLSLRSNKLFLAKVGAIYTNDGGVRDQEIITLDS